MSRERSIECKALKAKSDLRAAQLKLTSNSQRILFLEVL